MLIYSTVSPYYFDYLASCKTRQEVLDDPELCHFLQDPALKDNVELAFAYHDAKYGGYTEKKQFVEYLLCNGPEIDADTILYYREKAYQDPVYINIAEIEFNDFSIVDNLRVTKYNKSNNLEDCFTKPCNYLGPMSNVVGLMGDSNNFRTFPNIFSTLLRGTPEQKQNLTAAWGNIREHLAAQMLPNIKRACQVMYNCMYESMKDFTQECEKAKITGHINIGDPYSIDRADSISASTKINIHNKLGDCARIWEQMRRFNPYDSNQNQKGPIPDHAKQNNREMSGVATDHTQSPSLVTGLSPDKLRQAAGQGNKKAQWEIDLQNLKYPITLADYEFIMSKDHSDDEKYSHIMKITGGAGREQLNEYRNDTNEFRKNYQNNYTALDKLVETEEQQDQLTEKFHAEANKIINAIRGKSQSVAETSQKPSTNENITATPTTPTMTSEQRKNADEGLAQAQATLEKNQKEIEEQQNKGFLGQLGDTISEIGDQINKRFAKNLSETDIDELSQKND